MEATKTFPGISSKSWEHPADRAALGAFRAIPGADILVKKIIGYMGERSMRLLMLASSARVTERQFASVNRILARACETMDLAEKPEVYVTNNPFFNAGVLGVDKPFIILNSSIVDILSEKELLSIIGHELGHLMSGHSVYKTIRQILLLLSAYALADLPLAGLALNAIMAALNEWDRKSELSADRAGLLVCQDAMASSTSLMKAAAGGKIAEMDINEFYVQAAEYDAAGEALDPLLKLLNTLDLSHPHPVVRLAELKNWEKTGYQAILDGKYLRRGEDSSDMGADFQDAARTYKEDLRASKDPLANFASGLAEGAEELGKKMDKARVEVEDFLKGIFGK